MNVSPIKLELVGEQRLLIEWSDGQRRQYESRELRDGCPCATCRTNLAEEANEPPNLLPVLTEAQIRPLKITGVKPVGNYAYSIAFSDGHSTGIYRLDLLRELGQAAS